MILGFSGSPIVEGLWHMVGRDEKRLSEFEIKSELFTRWEDCSETVDQVAKNIELLSRHILAQ